LQTPPPLQTPSCAQTSNIVIFPIERTVFQHKVSNLPPEKTSSEIRVSTADILQQLTASEPATAFSFVVGSDSYADILAGKWKRVDEIKRLLEDSGGGLVLVGRKDGSKSSPEDAGKVEAGGEISIKEFYNVDGLGPVSSTQARETPSFQELTSIVGLKVANYIKANKLYGWSADAGSEKKEVGHVE
jgi:nicotinic acid mononucleotide adenylyltransferase